jgi:hypothetical protein
MPAAKAASRTLTMVASSPIVAAAAALPMPHVPKESCEVVIPERPIVTLGT